MENFKTVPKVGDEENQHSAGHVKSMEQRILIVEDETEIRDLISLHLKRVGLEADAVGSVEEADKIILKQNYSLLVLDWMLPGASGLSLAKRVRSQNKFADMGILMVTARIEAADIVEGLEAGSDDYLTKPFEPSVLIARVRALLRRSLRRESQLPDSVVKQIRLGGLELNIETHEAKCHDEPLILTPSEFKLLFALLQNEGRVLTRDSLIAQIQGEGVSVVGRTVDTHIFGLRKKLGTCVDVIETVRGIGYRVKSINESEA